MKSRASRVGADGEDAFGDHRADFLDEGDLAGAFAFGVLVGESAGCGGGLSADGPDPVLGVDVAGADAGDLADAGGGRGGEDDDLAPSSVVVVGSVGECLGEAEQGGPVAQGEGAGVVEFVLGLFVLALPAGDSGGVDGDDPVADGLFHEADEDGEAVLDGGAAVLVGDPAVDGVVDGAVGDHPDGEVPEGRDHTAAPAGEVGIECLELWAPQGQVHIACAVHGQGHGGHVRSDTDLGGLEDAGDPLLGLVQRLPALGEGLAAFGDGIEPADVGTVGGGAVGRCSMSLDTRTPSGTDSV
ncbi:hypothetical protein ACFU9X_09440 [Streptomyces atratus]|uniref:hypothetical protein n=1 Tax=Streptomyces atratus TaxID=1893 RepID=UPI0036CB9716